MVPSNLVDHLTRMALEHPEQAAIWQPKRFLGFGPQRYELWDYRRLYQETERLALGLMRFGVTKGTRVVLMVPPSLEFFALTFAIFKMGAIPVFIDPGMGVKSLKKCLAEAEPEVFIGIPKAHLARLLLGWQRGKLRALITVGAFPVGGGITVHTLKKLGEGAPEPFPSVTATDTAAILFTSGSTGLPKGAVYTQATFEAQIKALKDIYGIKPGEVDLCTFPLFALFAPALGMTAVIPEMDFTRPAKVRPEAIIKPVQHFRVTNLFGSPALLRRLVRSSLTQDPVVWASVKRIISAGAPVPHETLRDFSQRLSPEAEIFTPYGATEALPVCSIGSKEILRETFEATKRGLGVCVGKPVQGMTVAVIQITDQALPEWHHNLVVPDGSIGEIAVRGPQVTHAYFNRDEATKQAKMIDPETRDVWHRMGDLGYRDAQGRIWFCGRKTHRVLAEARTMFTIPCEAVFNTHPAIYRTALVGVGSAPKQKPVLCIEPERPLSPQERQQVLADVKALARQYAHTSPIDTFLFHKRFPVDIRHNAKIFREKLKVWAEQELV
jgi:acyl-CoA synthetase (AMP-forming)/AMP-acid ligase II